MKVLFLDNDGVICLSNNWGGRTKKWAKYRSANPNSSKELKNAPVQYRFDDFDKKAVKVLNEILEVTGAEIVVSSDWKLHATLEELGEYYESQGIIKKPIDLTPNMKDLDESGYGLFKWKGFYESIRIIEINEYLKNHPEVTHWVAVDDLNMGIFEYGVGGMNEGGLTNFVLTPKSTEGIKQSGVKEKILKFLK